MDRLNEVLENSNKNAMFFSEENLVVVKPTKTYLLSDRGTVNEEFYNNVDMAVDFIYLGTNSFKNKYPLVEDDTYQSMYESFLANPIEVICSLLRQTENRFLENRDNSKVYYTLYHCLTDNSMFFMHEQYSVDTLKSMIFNVARTKLTAADYNEFVDCCNAVAC